MPIRRVSPATAGGVSGSELGVGFIGSIALVPADKRDARRFTLVEIGFLARAGHVMGAPDDRLHPAEPRVPRGTHLLLGESGRRHNDKGLSALTQVERASRTRARTISPS